MRSYQKGLDALRGPCHIGKILLKNWQLKSLDIHLEKMDAWFFDKSEDLCQSNRSHGESDLFPLFPKDRSFDSTQEIQKVEVLGGWKKRAAVRIVMEKNLPALGGDRDFMAEKIRFRKVVQFHIRLKVVQMAHEWLKAMDFNVFSNCLGKNGIVSNSRSDIDKDITRRKLSNKIQKNLFFIFLMDIIFGISFPLRIHEVRFVDTNGISEGVNFLIHTLKFSSQLSYKSIGRRLHEPTR